MCGKSNNVTPRDYIYFSNAKEVISYIDSLEGKAIKPESKITPLLPSAKDFLEFIGYESNILVSLILSSHKQNEQMPFSRATIFKIPKFFNGLVSLSKKTQHKFISYFFEKIPGDIESKSIRLPKDFNGGAADGWLGLIDGIKNSKRGLGEFSVLIQFITERMNKEADLLTRVSNASISDEDRRSLYFDTLTKETLIQDEVIEAIRVLSENKEYQYSIYIKSLLVCSLKLDFYYSAIACLEVGLIRLIRIKSPELIQARPDWFVDGVIYNFIRKLRFNENYIYIENPFSLYLDWLAGSDGPLVSNSPISRAKLASFIPLENEEDTINGYTRDEKQKDLLKDWKKSNYPSHKKFYQFIINFSDDFSCDPTFLTDIGFVSIILDKLFLQLLDDLKVFRSVDSYKVMEESVLRYKEYRSYFENKYAGVEDFTR
ncbi:hypothetical protein [Nitrincola iocasae]|uniref:Uncharacterized protein n=1 Tax=Nitrincola iocasae TaxID=2614693 RepID=A0A5J6LCE5_9GAMM|nr:hypothetical protein [Nitrincola iocasae]QEW05882.1 hypothetical protein F5I99_04920 [Nitrincola iocasae]